MAELRSSSSSTPTAPSQDAYESKQNSATAYGVLRPSFSYLNGNNPPSGSSQQSLAGPVSNHKKKKKYCFLFNFQRVVH